MSGSFTATATTPADAIHQRKKSFPLKIQASPDFLDELDGRQANRGNEHSLALPALQGLDDNARNRGGLAGASTFRTGDGLPAPDAAGIAPPGCVISVI